MKNKKPILYSNIEKIFSIFALVVLVFVTFSFGTLQYSENPKMQIYKNGFANNDKLTSFEKLKITKTPLQIMGVYATEEAINSSRFENLIAQIENTKLNAMVINVKNDSGRISFDMNNAAVKEVGSATNSISNIKTILKSLKEKNIYVIARIVAFKDPFLAKTKQELAIKNKNGTLYKDRKGECWINPYRHEVWDYLLEIAKASALLGFDEIQFDYLRFPTGSGIANADYGEMSREKSKEEIITEFTKYAYTALKPLGVFVSADVYATIISSSIDANLIGQNYIEIAKNTDYICPMIYPSHFSEGNYGISNPDAEPYSLVRKVLTASKSKLSQIPDNQHCAIVRPWLQAFSATWKKNSKKYGAFEIDAQINAVKSVEYEQWLLWNPNCIYSISD